MKRVVSVLAVLGMLSAAALVAVTVDFRLLFASGQSWSNVAHLAGAVGDCTVNYAGCSLKGGKHTTEAYVSGFGFSLNGGGGSVRIDGIEVRIHGKGFVNLAIQVEDLWLIKHDYVGTRSPVSKGNSAGWSVDCEFQPNNPAGGSTDTWGWNPELYEITEGDIEDSGFGIVLVCANAATTGSPAVNLTIDAIEMKVYWSINGVSQTPQTRTAGAAQEL